MRKLFCLLLCCVLLTATAAAADVIVSKLNTKCNVQENGDLLITQSVTLQIEEPVSEIKLPVGKDVSNVSVSSESAAKHRLQNVDGNTYATLYAGEPFSGELAVTLSYRKSGTVENVENGQLFTAELLCGLWEWDPLQYKFSVLFPKEITDSPEYTTGLTQDLDGKLQKFQNERTVSGSLTGVLQNHESFTMQLQTEPGYFTGYHPTSLWFVAVLMFALFGFGVFYWLRFLRSGRLRPSKRSLPPDGITAAELPYLLCGEKPDFALLLFEWAADGYLAITQNRTGRITLQRSMPMRSERRETEQRLFRELFANSAVCEVGSERCSKVSEAASRMLRNFWARIAFARNSGNPLIPRALASLISALALLNTMHTLLPPSGARWLLLIISFVAGAVCGTLVWYGIIRWTVRDRLWAGLGLAAFLLLFLLSRGGGFLLMLLALAADVLAALATRYGGKRTASGSDVIEQCLGYSRFLGSIEEEQLQTIIEQDPLSFYRILIYACACGAERRVAQKAATAVLEPCDWFTAADGTSAVAPEFCRQLQALRKALR